MLDPATGEEMKKIELAGKSGGNLSKVRFEGDRIFAGAGKKLLCINRHDGKLVWQADCPNEVFSLAVGGGKVFCANAVMKASMYKGLKKTMFDATTTAFDAATGKKLWSVVDASLLRYSEKHDLLLTEGSAYRAGDGHRVWRIKGTFGGPNDDFTVRYVSGVSDKFAITDDVFLGGKQEMKRYDLRTGKEIPTDWDQPTTWRGCVVPRFSEHLVTHRMEGYAAYIDVKTGKFTPIWNVRTGCANAMYPACGVLNIPNFRGRCACNYMYVSQALAPTWTIDRPARATRR